MLRQSGTYFGSGCKFKNVHKKWALTAAVEIRLQIDIVEVLKHSHPTLISAAARAISDIKTPGGAARAARLLPA